MEIKEVKLLRFEIENKNNRKYSKCNIEPHLEKINSKPLFGVLQIDSHEIINDGLTFSHYFTNIRIEDDFLLGDLTIIDTMEGRLVQDLITDIVFRPKSIGKVDGKNIIIDELISFDAIHAMDDSFSGLMESNLNLVKMKKIKKKIDKEIFTDYFVNITSNILEDGNKELHDNYILYMSSKYISKNNLTKFLNNILNYYLESESYEICDIINKVIQKVKKKY
jgi:hypothetical protein